MKKITNFKELSEALLDGRSVDYLDSRHGPHKLDKENQLVDRDNDPTHICFDSLFGAIARGEAFVVPEKKTGWINIYKHNSQPEGGGIHPTKAAADAASGFNRIDCVEISYKGY